jgi:hypothetical protein
VRRKVASPLRFLTVKDIFEVMDDVVEHVGEGHRLCL